MKLKIGCVVAFTCLSFTMAAQANEVLLSANQPLKITFRLAHKKQQGQPVFGKLQSIQVSQKVSVPVALDNYDRAGIVIVSVQGHELPPTANQFDQPKQCAMTTDKTKNNGCVGVHFISAFYQLSYVWWDIWLNRAGTQRARFFEREKI